MKEKVNKIILKNIETLSAQTDKEMAIIPDINTPLPSAETLRTIVETVKSIIFPGFFDKSQMGRNMRAYNIGVNMEMLYGLLVEQIERGLQFCNGKTSEEVAATAQELAAQFINLIPAIKDALYDDVKAIFKNDPAAHNYGEVICCYPGLQAITHYRIAHELLEMNIPVVPRIITELAHSATGIDIHPGARIGKSFSIDHGTGVVVGETCIIGDNVTLYQGVTLGAKNFTLDNQGNAMNIPRHPVIEDNVTVYSNTTILGRVTIGHDTVIGGNLWLTHDVPPYSCLRQGKAVTIATPCDGSHPADIDAETDEK